MDYAALIAKELNLQVWQVANTLALLSEGATIPFIARYRKEQTGEMDETVLRELDHRFTYLKELDERRAAILKSIEEQGKLTPELKAKIFGFNASKIYGVDVPAQRKRAANDSLAQEKQAYLEERRDPSFVTYGPKTRREFFALRREQGGRP